MTRWSLIGCTFAFLTACKPDSMMDAPQERLALAGARLAAVRVESQKAVARSREKILAAEESTETSIASADEAEAALQDARLELQTLEETFATYRHTYRTKLRDEVLETSFPEVTLQGGRQLKDFQVRTIENATVRYASSESTGQIPLLEIPPEVASFLRLSEEAADRARFPELVPPRESDTDIDVTAAKTADETEKLAAESATAGNRQRIRAAKVRLKADYERREQQLRATLKELDNSRVKLATKRRRHQEYNDFNRTNVRDRAIGNLSRSIAKIDQRSRVIYEKMNTLRDLMKKNR